jgi:hypothetical protein
VYGTSGVYANKVFYTNGMSENAVAVTYSSSTATIYALDYSKGCVFYIGTPTSSTVSANFAARIINLPFVNTAAHPYVITVIFYAGGNFYGSTVTASTNSTQSTTAITLKKNGGTPLITSGKVVFQQIAITYFASTLVAYTTISQFS